MRIEIPAFEPLSHIGWQGRSFESGILSCWFTVNVTLSRSRCKPLLFLFGFVSGYTGVVGQSVIPEPATAHKFLYEINRFDSLNQVERYPADAILFTGSSSIKLWKSIQEDLPGVTAINRGFGGSRIEDVAYFLPAIISTHRVKAMVIMVGSNNITGGPGDMTPDSILLYTRLIIETIRQWRPGLPIFWIAITPTQSRMGALERIRQMHLRWKDCFARYDKVYFIDTVDRYLDEQGKVRRDLFLPDQLHLNRDGYRLWGEIIGGVLREQLQ